MSSLVDSSDHSKCLQSVVTVKIGVGIFGGRCVAFYDIDEMTARVTVSRKVIPLLPPVSPCNAVKAVAFQAITFCGHVHVNFVLIFFTISHTEEAGQQAVFKFKSHVNEGFFSVAAFVLDVAFNAFDAFAGEPG